MRRVHVANVLLIAGLAAGLAAAIAAAAGVVPQLSPFMQKVVFYKLAFIGAAGLLAAGAVLRRRARRGERDGREARVGSVSDPAPR